jgi:hypothetical protein
MLLGGDPGKSSEYGCVLIPLVSEGNALVDLILQPVPVKSGKFDGYRFVFGPTPGSTFSEMEDLFLSQISVCRKTVDCSSLMPMQELGVSLRDLPPNSEMQLYKPPNQTA